MLALDERSGAHPEVRNSIQGFPSNSWLRYSTESHKCQSVGSAREKVRGSPTSGSFSSFFQDPECLYFKKTKQNKTKKNFVEMFF